MHRAGLLAVTAACAFVVPRAAAAQPSPVPLRIGVQLDDGSAPILWAKNGGLFERAGLTVDIQKFTSGTAAAAAVAGGSLEIARSNPVALVTAHSKDVPFQVIAPVDSYHTEHPDLGMIVLTGSKLATAHDFEGKTIAVSALGDFYTLAARAWLEKNGANAESVHFVELPPPSIPAALDQGRIDGAPLAQPILEFALRTGKYRLAAKVFDAISPRFVESLYFARIDWINAHREQVEKFITVIRDANTYVNAHQSETIPLIASFMNLDPAAIARMPRPERTPYVDPAELQPIIDLLVRYKVIDKPFPAASMIYPGALPRR
jgi:NitT/TauT family transport system substrate-binding protein